MNFIDKDLAAIQEARVLTENAKIAQKLIETYSNDKLNNILKLIYENIDGELYSFSKMFVEESRYGLAEDEYRVNKRLLDALYKSLILENPLGRSGNNLGVPRGGIILIPSKKGSLVYIINLLLLAIKSANVLLIATDERAVDSTRKFVEFIQQILKKEDYPVDIISCTISSSLEGKKELLKKNELAIVVNAGNKELIKECNESGKVFYYGSTSASPVFIERSADIKYAVKDIVESRKFNNGILPGAEQFVVVDSPALEKVIENLKLNKAYIMNLEEENKLIKNLLNGKEPDMEKIGTCAYALAKEAGFEVPKDTSVLVSYQDYISEFNSYNKELACPILIIYREEDWLNACEKCIRLLTKANDGHSLSIYSNNEEVIEQFITKKPVGRVMINTNTTFSAMGIDSDNYPSAILGSFTRRIGVLSENLEAKDLVYQRKIVKSCNIDKVEEGKYINRDAIDALYKILENL